MVATMTGHLVVTTFGVAVICASIGYLFWGVWIIAATDRLDRYDVSITLWFIIALSFGFPLLFAMGCGIAAYGNGG